MVNVSFAELLKLSVPERIQLAEDLWDSIAAEPDALPLTDSQRAGIERRLAEHERDPDPTPLRDSAAPDQEARSPHPRRP